MHSLSFPRTRLLAATFCIGVLTACTPEETPYQPVVAPVEAGAPSTDSGAPTPGVPGVPGGGSPSGGGATGSDASVVTDAGSVNANGLPCAIQKIVQTKCVACHSDPPVGTFMPLVTQAHFQAKSTLDPTKKYFELAKTRINDAMKPMPPVTSPALSAEEKSAFTTWLGQGAPTSNERCADPVGPAKDGGVAQVDGGSTDSLDCYKFLAHAEGDKNKKFKVGVKKDGYFSFGFAAPWQGIGYAQVLRPVIDNSKVLHHWLLYREPTVDGLIKETIGQHELGELLAGWAPGGVTMDFRPKGDIGMELPPETYSLELHYNSDDANAEDASGVEVCVKKTKPQHIAGMSWVGYDHGGTLAYATGICLEPKKEWTGVCKPVSQEPIHLLYMVPHLHQTGRHLKSVINGPSGMRVLHDKPFDFNYQITFETSEILMPGESITTTCTFSENKCAGQATDQEMCYNFIYSYPKGALADHGIEGTFIHGESACLGQ